MRFNPPPNWPPPPEGWIPPAGWQPDPSWGPAPAGWHLWIRDDRDGLPVNSNGRSSKNFFIGLAAFLVLLVFLGIVLGGEDADEGSAFGPSTITTSPNLETNSQLNTEGTTPGTREQEPVPPAFHVETYQGTGDDVVTFESPDDALLLVTATHDGSSNFVLRPLTVDNAEMSSLVNEIGVYSGATVLDVDRSRPVTGLQISADGNWMVTVADVADAPVIDESGSASGLGDSVIWWTGDPGIAQFDHQGDSNFVVRPYTQDGSESSLINEIGVYSGKVPLRAGPVLLEISANGSWTISVR